MFVLVLAEVSMCKNPLLSAYLAASCKQQQIWNVNEKKKKTSRHQPNNKKDLGGNIPVAFSKVEFISNQRNHDAGITLLLYLFYPPFGLSQRLLYTGKETGN